MLNGHVSLSYRRASILDAPLIFELMLEGAINGSFSKDFIERAGSAKLLCLILCGIVGQHLQFKKTVYRSGWYVIALPDGQDCGFFKLATGTIMSNNTCLEIMAIHPRYRNMGLGTAVLEHLSSQMTNGAQLMVYCTKYARAMQHMLKRRRLKRNVRFGIPRLEEYSTVKQDF